jgi:hypothetical protein
MKIKLLFLMFVVFIFSCKNHNSETKLKNLDKNTTKIQIVKNEKKGNFDFDSFKIGKGSIGLIKVGMTIFNAEKNIKELTKKECEAFDFGFDGGGKAYIYYIKNEPILALVPKRDSDEILVLIAISNKLKTNNGLNPNSTVGEIKIKNPAIKINQDLMMGWEFIHDEKNNWDFVFMTEENNRIGEYKEIEMPTEPKRTETKTDWITIR